jgi:ribosome-associated protein
VDDSKPSKSARKREYIALQKLGEDLVPLLESDLRAMNLDDDLLAAVLEAKRMKKRGALRRQKQYIGKLMGRLENPEPVRAALERIRAKKQ